MRNTDDVRRLRRGEVLSIRVDRESVLARVSRGSVWATVEGDPRDHTARTGGILQLAGPGLAVIEALEDGTVVAVGAAPERPPGAGPAPSPTPPPRPIRAAA